MRDVPPAGLIPGGGDGRDAAGRGGGRGKGGPPSPRARIWWSGVPSRIASWRPGNSRWLTSIAETAILQAAGASSGKARTEAPPELGLAIGGAGKRRCRGIRVSGWGRRGCGGDRRPASGRSLGRNGDRGEIAGVRERGGAAARDGSLFLGSLFLGCSAWESDFFVEAKFPLVALGRSALSKTSTLNIRPHFSGAVASKSFVWRAGTCDDASVLE
jgi:hypothetical protein